MCLGIPARVLNISDSIAEVEIRDIRRKASLELIDDVKAGDYIILHAGFAITKLDEEDAKETLRLLDKILE